MTIIEQPKVIKFPVKTNEMLSLLRTMADEGLHFTQTYKDLLERYSYDAQQNSGVTGFTIISESHCALHTWPEQDFFTFCLYSCKPFNVEPITKYLQETFHLDPRSFNAQTVSRVMPQRHRD